MAITINARDVYLQSQTRLLPVTIPSGYDFAGNVTGSVNNVPASTVTTQANNGQIANAGTAQYRADSPPTNSPTGGVAPVIVNNDDGSRDITIAWTYTQGALPADGFILWYKQGATAILTTDPAYSLPATARSYRFMGAHQNTQYRAGIAAFRKTETGYQVTAIYQPSSVPSWIVAGTATLIGNVLVGTLTGNAQAGFNIQQQLEISGTTVLRGVVVPTDSGALKTGSITWNQTTGALTGGSGCAMTEWGIIGAKVGAPSFTIDINGNAIFAGDLVTGGDVYATGLNTQSISLIISGTSRSVDYSVYGYGNSAPGLPDKIRSGVVGKADAASANVFYNVGVAGIGLVTNKGIGVAGQGEYLGGYFDCTSVAGATAGLKAVHSGTGNAVTLGTPLNALEVTGKMTIDNSTLVVNLNAQKLNGLQTAGHTASGGGSATFSGAANKPGVGNTTNRWLQFTLDTGEIVDVPVWPRA